MRQRQLRLIALLAAMALAVWIQPADAQFRDVSHTGDLFGAAVESGDFNADGRPDLAIGVPGDDLDTGAIEVLFGTAEGLQDSQHQYLTGSFHVAPNSKGEFGSTLESGDFNGDGIDDLAVGVPSLLKFSSAEAGSVRILHGETFGLTRGGQGRVDVAVRIAQAKFGSALAAGDLNGDGFDDLAVGAPGGRTPSIDRPIGTVHVVFGSPNGLPATRNDVFQEWSKDSAGIEGDATDGDRFGQAVVIADFDGDGFEDLAIGVPGDDFGGVQNAGGVHVLYGSSEGPTTDRAEFWHQKNNSVKFNPIGDEANNQDELGASLTAGDFNGDGFADLAIGATGEEIDGESGAGQVHVLLGSDDGLVATDEIFFHQGMFAGESPEFRDGFGTTLSAGDFNADGIADLVIGVPLEDIGNFEDIGLTHIVYGGKEGMDPKSAQTFHLLQADFQGQEKSESGFSHDVTVGDFDADGLQDLAVGIPEQDFSSEGVRFPRLGAVSILFSRGKAVGLSGKDHQDWQQPLVVAVRDVVETLEDVPVLVRVTDNDLRTAGSVDLNVVNIHSVQRGQVERLSPESNDFVFTPSSDASGAAQFFYDVTSPLSNYVSTAAVSISVVAVNDAPRFLRSNLPSAVARQSYDAEVFVRDPEDDAIQVEIVSGPPWLSIVEEGDKFFLRGVPQDSDVGDNEVVLSTTDGALASERTFTLTVDFGVPVAPSLLQPADAEEDVIVPPTLHWSTSFGASRYRVQVTTATDFSTTVVDTTGVADTTLVVATLLDETLYFWRVLAENDAGASDFSAPARFTTGGRQLTAPTAPAPVEPANGVEGLSRPVTFSWQAVGVATSYRLQIAEDADFFTLAFDSLGIGTTSLTVNELSPGTRYHWRVQASNSAGDSDASSAFTFTTATNVANESVGTVPAEFAIQPAYPNPFNPQTNLSFDVPAAHAVRIAVFDLTGREMAVLVDATVAAGRYTTSWNARDLPSGTYLVRMTAGDFVATQTAILLK